MPVSAKDLESRMVLRNSTWTLNLRSKIFPEPLKRRITLYEPGSSLRWPEEGRSTAHEGEAKAWLPKYAAWINREIQQRSRQGSAHEGPRYVGHDAQDYIAHLEETKGLNHNTTTNRRSAVKNHIIPGLGHRLTSTLDDLVVQQFLDGLTVIKRRHGIEERVPAKLTTKQAVRDVLRDMWRWKYVTQPPFSGVRLRDSRRQQEVRAAVMAGRFEDVLPRGSYLPEEIERILVRAMMIDLMRPINVSKSNSTYTATVIALQFGFATRIAELTLMRWSCVEEDGLVLVPGLKNKNAFRWMIIFDSVQPWIEEARRLAMGATGPMNWLLRVDPRPDQEMRPPAVSTIQTRITSVLEAEDLKFPQKCTHVFRASTLTTLTSEKMDVTRAKLMLGHAAIGGATEEYLKRAEFLRLIQPQDRHHLGWLPSPDRVKERALEALERQGRVPAEI